MPAWISMTTGHQKTPHIPDMLSYQSAIEVLEEMAMRDDACVETVCSYQHVQHVLDAEHRLQEAIARAREQLMHCQHALDQLARARKCPLLRQLPLGSSSV